MASLLSGAKRHSRCFFGVALGSTFRQCSINSLGTLAYLLVSTRIYAVSPNEADERACLFVSEATPDQISLGRIVFLQLDGLDADVAGVRFNSRLARPLVGDIHL
jgi:hypothetical protein